MGEIIAHDMKISLIISTYNSPKYLALALNSVLMQTRMPDEVIVADDGSGEETRMLIAKFQKQFKVPLIHVWQPDEGFRVCRIRNKAINTAAGDYIIQIDGDIIMHPHFIEDHEKNAKPGYFAAGCRTFLSEEYSKVILESGEIDIPMILHNCMDTSNARRIPILTPFFKYRRLHNKTTIRGCNMAYWKKDALSVNGYNEDFEGWGSEDCDFSIRLSNSGLKKLWLKFTAIAIHIYHTENSRDNEISNRKLMNETMEKGLTYVPNGIKKSIWTKS
jgi:glycosyltransferase involved in cell wall biosynthesis